MQRRCPSETPELAPALLTHSLGAGQSPSPPAWPELAALRGNKVCHRPQGPCCPRCPTADTWEGVHRAALDKAQHGQTCPSVAEQGNPLPLPGLRHLGFAALSSFSRPANVRSVVVHAWHCLSPLTRVLITVSDRNISCPRPLAVLPPLLWELWPRREVPGQVRAAHALPCPVLLVPSFLSNAAALNLLPTPSLCSSLNHLILLNFGANIPPDFSHFTPLLPVPSAQPQTHLPALLSPTLAIFPAAALHHPAPPLCSGRARHEPPEPCSAQHGSPWLTPAMGSGAWGQPRGAGDMGTRSGGAEQGSLSRSPAPPHAG